MSVALLFNGALYAHTKWRLAGDPRYAAYGAPEDVALQVALEFLTGYLVEYSLSIDNIFVFVLVFRYFSVPARYQHHVLFYGILGALVAGVGAVVWHAFREGAWASPTAALLFGGLMAVGVISLAPVFVLFLLLEPFLVSGMTQGAVAN